MTKDQKTFLRALAVFVGFKAALAGGIIYASRYARSWQSSSQKKHGL